jgi:hypothetical protein
MIYDMNSFLPYQPLKAYMEELPQEAIDYFRKISFRRVYGQEDCLLFPGERFPYYGLVLEGIVCGFTQDGYQRHIHWVACCGDGFAGLVPQRSAQEQIHIGFLTTTQLVLIAPSDLRYATKHFDSCKKLVDKLDETHALNKNLLAQIQMLPNAEDRLSFLKSLNPQLELILTPYQKEELVQLPFDRPVDRRYIASKKRPAYFLQPKENQLF